MVELGVLQNIILGLTVTATIGPVTIETIRRGLKEGFFSALALNLGAVLVDLILLLVIFFGLSPWLNNDSVKIVLGIFGIFILLYLSYGSVMEFFAKRNILDKKIKISYKNSFLTGFAINGSNPLALVCWLGFYGFIQATSAYNVDSLTVLSNLIYVIIGGAIWGVILCTFAHIGRKFVNENSMRYVSLAAGIVLLVFAIYLASTVYSLVYF